MKKMILAGLLSLCAMQTVQAMDGKIPEDLLPVITLILPDGYSIRCGIPCDQSGKPCPAQKVHIEGFKKHISSKSTPEEYFRTKGHVKPYNLRSKL